MREIVLDTETTGFDVRKGDRLVEIGCVELFNHIPTGKVYHQYINPERDVPQGAVDVHGLTEDYLKDFPIFKDIAEAFVAFIGDATLVIHNAAFDVPFLNGELKNHGMAEMTNNVVDTLTMARKKFPGSPASLDALCKRFDVDNSGREKHGALLDSELLAEVYLELIGGRQPDLVGAGQKTAAASVALARTFRDPRPHAPSPEELAAHQAFLEKLDNPVWNRS